MRAKPKQAWGLYILSTGHTKRCGAGPCTLGRLCSLPLAALLSFSLVPLLSPTQRRVFRQHPQRIYKKPTDTERGPGNWHEAACAHPNSPQRKRLQSRGCPLRCSRTAHPSCPPRPSRSDHLSYPQSASPPSQSPPSRRPLDYIVDEVFNACGGLAWSGPVSPKSLYSPSLGNDLLLQLAIP